MRLTCLRLHHENQSARPVFRSNAEGALRVDLSTRFTIVEPVVGLIGRPLRLSTIAGPQMRSGGVNLGPTGRSRGRVGAKQAAAPVYASVYIRMCAYA